ncbi:14 kDa phosphohistidine phosphatase-like protein [Lates japonicus]|uniref:14 kDa phosphohistidine phosphatase-like protein n=1 Tax=Lates japonicus TaxID=270547 RepID=A0AAD3NIG9_LATJO|nr:14 kDa phosphohistidine phosphatase-like protein [Lates japonicus]
MANIPRADIDPSGVFKYVLIGVLTEEGDDSEMNMVRGYGWSGVPWRENQTPQSQAKKIHVYGYSMWWDLEEANHAVTTETKDRYPDCEGDDGTAEDTELKPTSGGLTTPGLRHSTYL